MKKVVKGEVLSSLRNLVNYINENSITKEDIISVTYNDSENCFYLLYNISND